MNVINLEGLNESVVHYKRKDGLDIYVYETDKVQSYMASLVVKYGSIHTDFKNKTYPTGIAHFLEHLKFNINEDDTVHEYYLNNNAEVNAYTTFDHTNYYIKGNSDYLNNVLFLYEFVMNNYFSEELIEKEKNIILEEAKSGLDNPYYLSYFKLNKNLFKNINYKNEVIGSLEDIKKTNLKDITSVFDNFYVPNNMFLVVSGNVDSKKIINELKKLDTLNTLTIPLEKHNEDIDPVVKNHEILTAKINVPKIDIGVKLSKKIFNNYNDVELNSYLTILMSIVFGETGNFSEKIYKEGLVYSFNYSNSLIKNQIVFYFSAEGEKLENFQKQLFKTLNNLNIEIKDFDRKKKMLLARIITSFDSHEVVNDLIKSDLLLNNKIIFNIKNILEKLNYNDFVKIQNKLYFDNIAIVETKNKE